MTAGVFMETMLMEKRISQAISGGFFRKLESSMQLDAAVVGAGPSGLLAAMRIAQAGKNVAIFERNLAPGGGIWGGAMLFNEVVFQKELTGLLDELGVRYETVDDDIVRTDSVEMASALIYKAVNAGAKLFNAVSVEDVESGEHVWRVEAGDVAGNTVADSVRFVKY